MDAVVVKPFHVERSGSEIVFLPNNLFKLKNHNIMTLNFGQELKGKKVKLIKMVDPYTDLKAGDIGVIEFVDDAGQIHVSWENGSRLALIPGVDEYEIIDF
jgi:hypothetical protein